MAILAALSVGMGMQPAHGSKLPKDLDEFGY
jgi:hypothetical protein